MSSKDGDIRLDPGESILPRKRHDHLQMEANVYQQATNLLPPLEEPQPFDPAQPAAEAAISKWLDCHFFALLKKDHLPRIHSPHRKCRGKRLNDENRDQRNLQMEANVFQQATNLQPPLDTPQPHDPDKPKTESVTVEYKPLYLRQELKSKEPIKFTAPEDLEAKSRLC